MRWFRSLLRPAAVMGTMAIGAAIGVSLAPAPAQAWWRGGMWVGVAPPYYYPAPYVYAPPPAYYAPPPAYYAPPPVAYGAAPPPPGPRPAGQSCYAGATPLCPMDNPTTPGSTCWCTTQSGRVYGRAY